MGTIDKWIQQGRWNLVEKRQYEFRDQINVGNIPFTRHLYVCGLSGMGKTTTIHNLLQKKKDVPFLIIEPTQSREYRKLKGLRPGKRPFYVYSIGDDYGNKMDLNPFYFPFGMDFTAHIELLKACFSAAMTTKEPLVYQYIERAIPEVYFDKGWDRITHLHRMLLCESDYKGSEHYFYFPRMQDLYNKVVELSESSDFAEGGENKGTIRELVKSSIRVFLSGALGITFNTYQNDLYEKFDKCDIVLEIPNTISPSISAILNILLGTVIEIIGQRKLSDRDCESEEPKHITVFEEAQLLFNVNDEDKLYNATTKKLEQLLSTARKFKESIIITNQDPAAIHKSVLGNIRQRFIHRINSSDVAQRMADDYHLVLNDMLHLISRWEYWYCRDYDQYQAMIYPGHKIKYPQQPESINISIPQTSKDFILGYAGLNNINEQIAVTFDFLTTLYKNQDYVFLVHTFKNILSALIETQCKLNYNVLPEYMAYLTCIAIVKSGNNLASGTYDELITYYGNIILNTGNKIKIPEVISPQNLFNVKVLQSRLSDEYQGK